MPSNSVGWVLEMMKNSVWFRPKQRRFYTTTGGYVGDLRSACIIQTRSDARRLRSVDKSGVFDEVVRRVSVGTDGKPIETIPGR